MVAFYMFAAGAIVSGLMVVTAPRIFHSALWLAACLVSVAGIFFVLDAEFVAAAQLLIYAGAITLLMIFAIMFTQKVAGWEARHIQRGVGLPLGVAAVLLAVILLSVRDMGAMAGAGGQLLPAVHSTPQIGAELMHTYVIPFEVASVFLVAAMIGAIVLARRD
jgi:NADH-quinone oxidoreductase subunit J